MTEQEPDFEVPEVVRQMTKKELDVLLVPDESADAIMYNGLRTVFRGQARDTAAKTHSWVPSHRGRPDNQ